MMTDKPQSVNELPCYIAIGKCGCVQSMILDTPDLRDARKSALVAWVRKGWTIERRTFGDVTEDWTELCTCKRKAREERKKRRDGLVPCIAEEHLCKALDVFRTKVDRDLKDGCYPNAFQRRDSDNKVRVYIPLSDLPNDRRQWPSVTERSEWINPDEGSDLTPNLFFPEQLEAKVTTPAQA